MGRRNSDGAVTMGFPTVGDKGKGQQLVEMFGFRLVPPLHPLPFCFSNGQEC